MVDEKWPINRFHHIHTAAKDIAVPERILRKLGVPLGGYNHPGEFKVADGIDLEEFWARDYRFCRVSTAHLQFMSPHRDGRYRAFLEQNGNRVYSMGYVVDDVDAAEAEMLERGLTIRTRGRHSDGWGFTYFETLDELGILICIRQSAANESLTAENTASGPFATFSELAIVTSDMAASVAAFGRVGFTFHDDTVSDVDDVTGVNRDAFVNLSQKICRIGHVTLRLIEPGQEASLIQTFAKTWNRRAFSLGFDVKGHLDAADARAREAGLEPLARVSGHGRGGFILFDTLKDLGFYLKALA